MAKKQSHHISLAEWIELKGTDYVADALQVCPATVRHWRRGLVYPQVPIMRKIREITKGQVGYEQIIDGGHINYAKTTGDMK